MIFWLLLTIFWTAVMSFYSSQEMAVISCNRVRLDYAVAHKKRWALLLKELLYKPTHLFTTTLIGVNVAMMISSECSRHLFEACGLNPNLALLFEIPFVLLFGELVPLFAARAYAEHACRLGVPLLYLSALALRPITAVVEFLFSRWRLGNMDAHKGYSLNREELQYLLEEHRKTGASQTSLFALMSTKVYELMEPFPQAILFPAHATVKDVRKQLEHHRFSLILLFLKTDKKIIGVLPLADLLQAPNHKLVREYSRTPIFVPEQASAGDILQFQKKGAPCVIILNEAGNAQGMVTFRNLMESLFDEEEPTTTLSFEKTFAAETPIAEVNRSLHLNIDTHGCATFAELVNKTLGRTPIVGDTLMFDSVELVVKKVSFFGAKTILLRSRY